MIRPTGFEYQAIVDPGTRTTWLPAAKISHDGGVTTTGPGAPRRTELAAFLRARREAIIPEEVGLRAGPRRRTPGLRREEVAELAGVGVVWYTWLEQGRRISPSTQVLDAIARTLRLDPTEHEHLYRLVGMPSPPPNAPVAPAQEHQVILDALNPLPAVLVTARYDVLAFNDAYAALDPAIALLPAAERNVLWHLFTTEEHLLPLVDWDGEVPFMVAQLRAEFGKRLGDPHWTGFIRRLTEASARFAELWARYEVAAPVVRNKSFRSVDGAEVEITSTAFAVAAAPDTRMWVYTPVTPESARVVGRLIDRYREAGPAELLATRKRR
ncbi:helix-turn-helix transcriptional regulator [Saccharopolyspora indica]|uniref:helix-turn-helix transcriptional regulator n=1 Tax=Saccharopolyspora indica TaxID=1229659 RepID=UPI0022EA31BE|nr:helix-turn-helix transcriptional regulator [Saccharopolyspora indica]MDA3649485.1 helix-turn-helix transcriptional regulator [Saccharopolyspora indica]